MAAIANPKAAQMRTRWAVLNRVITDITAIPKPMQFKISTFNRLVHAPFGQLKSQSCTRNSSAIPNR